MTVNDPRATIYRDAFERFQRDPYSEQGPTAVAMGTGFAKWRRFNKGEELVWVTDADGNPRALTPKQASVISLAQSMVDGPMLTMRAMAVELGVNVSTVSRALGKAQAWGLLVYIVGRGRFAGLVIVRYIKGDGFMESKRKAAKARVQRWREAAERRISRLQANVAPYLSERVRGKEVDSLYYYLTSITTKGATLKPWTAEDMAEIV